MTTNELRRWDLQVMVGHNELSALRDDVLTYIDDNVCPAGTLFTVPAGLIVLDLRDFIIHYDYSCDRRDCLFVALCRYTLGNSVQDIPGTADRVIGGLARVLTRLYPQALCESALNMIPKK